MRGCALTDVSAASQAAGPPTGRRAGYNPCMLIVALFTDQQKADRAVDALLEHHFTSEQITVSAPALAEDPFPDGSVRVQVDTEDRRAVALRIFEDSGALDIN